MLARHDGETTASPTHDALIHRSPNATEPFKNCIANINGDPKELATRAYMNSSLCEATFPEGSQLYQNCIQSALSPTFIGDEQLEIDAAFINALAAQYAALDVVLGTVCVITVVCGEVAGTAITLFDAGSDVIKLINGDESWSDALLQLGTSAAQTLLLVSAAKAVSAGFRMIKTVYTAVKDARKAEATLELAELGRLRSLTSSWLQSCAHPNSFAPGTPVVMADGSTKAIEDVRIGDNVLTTDPSTGSTQGRPITDTITGTGQKDLVDISLRGGGEITATTGHPFWVSDLGLWVTAGQLRPGQFLRTSAGTWVQISAINRHTERATVYNLTVAVAHTYYVAAGSTQVLVHNSSCLEMQDLGNGFLESPAGLLYGPGSSEGQRAFHISLHLLPNIAGKAVHSIFNVPDVESLFALIDEAWASATPSMVINQDFIRDEYYIPMGRVIGTDGETAICIVVKYVRQIITAYPSTNGKCAG